MTEDECWRCLADSCAEHDAEHYTRALAALALLTQRGDRDVPQDEAEGRQVRQGLGQDAR